MWSRLSKLIIIIVLPDCMIFINRSLVETNNTILTWSLDNGGRRQCNQCISKIDKSKNYKWAWLGWTLKKNYKRTGPGRRQFICLIFGSKKNGPCWSLTGAPWFVSNQPLHNDLKITTLPELASQSYKNLHTATNNHQNPLISNVHSLTNAINPLCRLKRWWPRDLLNI